jgi:hypothetical protein
MIQRRAAQLVVLLCFIALCGACGASSRLKVFRVNVIALNTARDAVLALSKEREKQLYDSCNPPTCTKEEGHARVDAWQKKVDAVIHVIDVGYRAQHDAALLDDAKSAAAAAAAAAKALDLYKELKEEKP